MNETANDCPHDDWEIRGPELRMNATCTKCGSELSLADLLNNWKARMEREFREAIAEAKA